MAKTEQALVFCPHCGGGMRVGLEAVGAVGTATADDRRPQATPQQIAAAVSPASNGSAAPTPTRRPLRLSAATPPPHDDDQSVEDAIELCDEILDDIDALPGRAGDFGASVREKVEDIRETIVQKNRVSARQCEALGNMHRGVLRWLEHGDDDD